MAVAPGCGDAGRRGATIPRPCHPLASSRRARARPNARAGRRRCRQWRRRAARSGSGVVKEKPDPLHAHAVRSEKRRRVPRRQEVPSILPSPRYSRIGISARTIRCARDKILASVPRSRAWQTLPRPLPGGPRRAESGHKEGVQVVTMWRSPRSSASLRTTGQRRPSSATSPRNWSDQKERNSTIDFPGHAGATSSEDGFGTVENSARSLPPPGRNTPHPLRNVEDPARKYGVVESLRDLLGGPQSSAARSGGSAGAETWAASKNRDRAIR